MEGLKISMINLDRTPSCNLGEGLRAILAAEDAVVRDCRPAGTGEPDLPAASGPQADILILILPKAMTDFDRAWIRECSAGPGRIPIVAVVEDAKTSGIMELFEFGVTDFITPPFRAGDVMPRLLRLAEHVRKKSSLSERLKETIGLRQIIGKSPALAAELRKIPFVAGCDSSVLVFGETGTGKEMFARAIHYLGPRSDKPFTPVNCGAIPADLIENELFGHARGAFTSAVTSEKGIIHEADGGTLFLDEIDCLPLAAQVKLLRFLQEKEYRQLGSARTKRADVRIVAATNIDLDEAVNQGRFRRDLYYRLNTIPLDLPPLKARREDIPLLARHFLEQYSLEFNKELDDFSPEAEQKLLLYDWPGNVRELQNIIERAVVFSSGPVLRPEDLPMPRTETAPPSESFRQAKARIIVEFEKNYIHTLLVAHGGNITQAAKKAGKNRRAFWELIRKHSINVHQCKSFLPRDPDVYRRG